MAIPLAASDVGSSDFREVALRRTTERIPEVDSDAFAVAFGLVRAAAAHLRESEGRLHQHLGLTWRAFEALYVIWVFDEIEARDLARFTGVSRQTISNTLRTLEKDGLITRERNSARDRRLVQVRLTPQGQCAIEHAFKEQHRLERQWFEPLSDTDQQALQDLLGRITTSITAGGDSADRPAGKDG